MTNGRPLWNYAYRALKGEYPPERFAHESLVACAFKPVRKWVTVAVIPYCPFNKVRIALYRLMGFKIGKNVFIGMRCYLDDMCYELLTIGDNVTISYGVYFACHGRGQGHLPITLKDGAYVGMRANLISKNTQSGGGVTVGRNAVVGACTLVNRDIPDGATAVGVPCRIIERG